MSSSLIVSWRKCVDVLAAGSIASLLLVAPATSQVNTTVLPVTVNFCYPIAKCKLNGGEGDILAMTKTEYTAAGMQCLNQVQDVQGPQSSSRQLEISNKAAGTSDGAKPTDVQAVFIKSAQVRSQIKPCLEISDGASGRWEYTVSIAWAG